MREAAAVPASTPPVPTAKGHIDIELPVGRVQVHGRVDAETLRTVLPVPVALQDERFTTVEAERGLRDAGMKGTARRSVVSQKR